MRVEEALRVAARARIPYYKDPNVMKSFQGKYIVAYYGADHYLYFSLHWADSMRYIKDLPADEEHRTRGRSDWEPVNPIFDRKEFLL